MVVVYVLLQAAPKIRYEKKRRTRYYEYVSYPSILPKPEIHPQRFYQYYQATPQLHDDRLTDATAA